MNSRARKFVKRPVVIEAIQYTGDNLDRIIAWVQPGIAKFLMPEGWWIKQVEKHGEFVFHLMIPTPEGEHEARIGDYIIKGVAGEFYPCKPEIFAQTYSLHVEAPVTQPGAR